MKIIKNIFLLICVLILTTASVYWTEAQKEIEVLCSLFDRGKTSEYVIQTLDTGNLLRYEFTENTLTAESPYNFYSNRCIVDFSNENMVLTSSLIIHFDLKKTFLWIGIILSVFFAVFQLLLALGYPLGKYAWGGHQKNLPKKLRIASLLSVLFFGFTLLLLFTNLNGTFLWASLYPVLGVLFLLNTFANLNSFSKNERWAMTPAALLLYLCFLHLSLW